ncbi:MAG: hypothetical protein J6Y82_02670 [Bacteroidales bacterium]|nr:hypothetical protein [Bacteroidales bacterium]
MIKKESLETAYCFLHQKQRVYQYSTLDWQRDDIEYVIANFVTDGIDKEIYDLIANGRKGYLLEHEYFGADMVDAVAKLEKMLFNG